MPRLELVGWIAVAVVLCVFAIPWFLWDDATVVAGVPLWLWWHIGWMVLASLVFWLFTQRAWGIGIETASEDASSGVDSSDAASSKRPSRPASGGDRP
ncbi:DUF3311 domain-containing protein [Natronolimnohabitans sp. A-GB9]|uniref:DUF3311 domain-containing protein n=1 Tax=Natronolimnohabitans sp. A-GB9 TaxID=3069757 RepID=UPI0027B2DA5E|nr:DUF3311 domain-containing protein [Natronolimnohabitans sp. A-GB9]MDQ2050533.1 DUF3311 domain-containing protein [Natronolimnohabitans sp. A-GB9]